MSKDERHHKRWSRVALMLLLPVLYGYQVVPHDHPVDDQDPKHEAPIPHEHHSEAHHHHSDDDGDSPTTGHHHTLTNHLDSHSYRMQVRVSSAPEDLAEAISWPAVASDAGTESESYCVEGDRPPDGAVPTVIGSRAPPQQG